MSTCMSTHMSTHMSIHMPIHKSIHMPSHTSTYMSAHTSTHMRTHVSIHMSTDMPPHTHGRPVSAAGCCVVVAHIQDAGEPLRQAPQRSLRRTVMSATHVYTHMHGCVYRHVYRLVHRHASTSSPTISSPNGKPTQGTKQFGSLGRLKGLGSLAA